MPLDLKKVDLNLLTVFDAIMRTGQLSRAGDLLGLSQPAVSAALQRLRKTTGDELFIRVHKGVQPTARARALHEVVIQALDAIRVELETGEAFDPANCQRQFRLTGGDYLELLYLGPILQRTTAQAPGVGCDNGPLQLEGFSDDLLRGDVDLAIHYTVPRDQSLNFETVGTDALVMACREGHPRIGDTFTQDDFCAELHIALGTPGDQRTHIENFADMRGLERRLLARVNQFSSMVPVLLATDCVAVMPERLARLFARHSALAVHAFPVDISPFPVNLIWAHRYNNDPAHRWFREEVRAVMQERDNGSYTA